MGCGLLFSLGELLNCALQQPVATSEGKTHVRFSRLSRLFPFVAVQTTKTSIWLGTLGKNIFPVDKGK